MGDDQTFLLPDLGEGLTEGEVARWLVGPGDTVEVDQPVAEVETAKAVVEVPCPFAGTVLALHAEPGDEVAVGQPLMTISRTDDRAGATAEGSAGQAAEGPAGQAAAEGPAGSAADAEPAGGQPASAGARGEGDEGSHEPLLVGTGTAKDRPRRRRGGAGADGDGHRRRDSGPASATAADATGRPLAKPPVRKLAKDLGIELADVPPSGPGGVITREDVEAFAGRTPAGTEGAPAEPAGEPVGEPGGAPPARPAPAASGADPLGLLADAPAPPEPRPGGPELVERRPLKGVRRTIAAHMTRSRAEIPEAVTWVDADATELLRTRDELTAAHPGRRISPLALILRACVAGLRRYPEVNSRLDVERGEIVVQRFVNLGFAAQTDAGLMVPVIHGADRLSTLELAGELRRLATAARDRTITPGELSGSTFTVSNYGSFGMDGGDMVINHPEAAILGVGRIAERPWVVDGSIVARHVVNLSIAFDHRICDGGEAAGFLRFVADCVESPGRLLAEL